MPIYDVMNNPLKSWRCWALLALFVSSFLSAWGNLLFWIGLLFFLVSEPDCRAELNKRVGPVMILAGLCIPTFYLSFIAYRTLDNPFTPVALILALSGTIGLFLVWRHQRNHEIWVAQERARKLDIFKNR